MKFEVPVGHPHDVQVETSTYGLDRGDSDVHQGTFERER